MKKTLLFTALLMMAVAGICQTFNKAELPKNPLLIKSKKQKIGGIALLSAGGLTIITAATQSAVESAAITTTSVIGSIFTGTPVQVPDNKKSYTGLYVTGAAAFIAGVVFLELAKHNKQKALNLALDIQQSKQLKNSLVSNVSYPALKLTMHF